MNTAKRFRQKTKRQTEPLYGVLVGNKGLSEFVKNAPTDFTQRGKLNGLDTVQ